MPAADVAVKCAKQARVDTPIPQAHRRSGEISAAERKTTPPEKARRHSGINRQFAREPRNSERNPQFGRECRHSGWNVAVWTNALRFGRDFRNPQAKSRLRTTHACGRACNSRRRVRAVVCRAEQTRQYATRACAQPAPTGNKARNRLNPPEAAENAETVPKLSEKQPKAVPKPLGFAPSDSICTKSREGKTQKPHRIRGRAPVESVLETINALRTGNAYAHRADRTSYVPWLWGRESSSRPS